MNLPFIPHDYQLAAFGDACHFIDNDANAGDKRLYSSPTGTGKSVMELMILGHDRDAMLVTPRLEIIAGMLQKQGLDPAGWSDAKLAEVALENRITTPIRLRNMLAKGELLFRPFRIILDECHHALANTYKEIAAYLPDAVWIGFTATPYRGTPQETKQFHDEWGGVTQVLSMRQAVERGCIALPVPEVWPLLDDDMIEIRNGELHVADVDRAASGLIQAVVERCRRFVREQLRGAEMVREAVWWTRPTMFSVPTVNVGQLLTDALTDEDLPAELVTQDTSRADRNRIFADAVARRCALVQIDVVSEGVDLPMRRLIDLRPTLSPVKWMQQLGRITRPLKPGESPSEYYTVNRNLERHGYLFDGAMPAKYLKSAQDAFERPTRRVGQRAFGLETIGRFTAAELPLLSGMRAHAYFLTATDQFTRTEFAAVVHPATTEILYATRESTRNETGEFAWGKWKQIDDLPGDLRGYGSAPAKTLTERQAAWWVREAAHYGLDPASSSVNRRNFTALPLLKDLRYRLKN